MKILIVIVVALHLVSGAAEGELQYGDIIAVSRTCLCSLFTYKHYGIYLDKKRFERQNADDNIFHFPGPRKSPSGGCIFDKIDIQNFEKDNYLDKIESYKNKASTEEITKRIGEEYERCGKQLLKKSIWEGITNNCEHLATYIRYGEKISLQLGQKAAALVYTPKETKQKIKQQLKILNEVPCDDTCKKQGTEILKNDHCDENCANTNIG